DRAQAGNADGRRPGLRQAGPERDHALRRRGATRQAVEGTLAPRHRAHAVHPRRTDHRAALPRHRAPARGAAQAARRWQHDRGDRTQPGRDHDRRLDRGPGARGWPPRRAGHRPGHAGRGGRQSRFLHRPVPGQGAAGRWRRRIDPGQDEVEEEVSRMSDTTREPLFRFPVTPRWRDLDAFNHVNNSNFLTYLEEARIRMFASLGKPWFDEHMAPLLAAVQLNYRAPIAYPSE